jgi:hypothetical protein
MHHGLVGNVSAVPHSVTNNIDPLNNEIIGIDIYKINV